MMLRTSISLAIALALAAPALAQTGHVAERQAIMKGNGKGAKAGGAMLKGEVPFDAAAAQKILSDMAAGAKAFGTHFPKGSETGGDTEAAPAVWTKPAEWKAAVAKFEKDTAAAAATRPAALPAFGQAFSTVTANCKSCHEAFKIKKG
ncbi:cytochrome c [Sandarakinorhabdus sp.]|uniref:c-type cytochrome n=1 Tax=Sandarakinorhabdus sp. TaxID=1916663 RepID=UPI00286E5CD9|nr:cytochrome c [Sandarakinorhabdus sp.]